MFYEILGTIINMLSRTNDEQPAKRILPTLTPTDPNCTIIHRSLLLKIKYLILKIALFQQSDKFTRCLYPFLAMSSEFRKLPIERGQSCSFSEHATGRSTSCPLS